MKKLVFCDLRVCLIENRSTTRSQQRVWGIKSIIWLFHMWPTVRSVSKNKFSMCLAILECAESNAERWWVQLFMQRLEFYDLKLVSKIARKSLNNKGSARYEPVQGICMPASYVTHRMRRVKLIFRCFYLFSSMLNLMPSGAKFNYICKASNFTTKICLENHSTRTLMKGPARYLIQ